MSDSLKSRLDEQDLLEDNEVSSIIMTIDGKRMRVFSLTCVDGLTELVCQKNIDLLPKFLSKAKMRLESAALDLDLVVIPKSIDVDFRVDQTMTLSFEIVS